MTSVKDDSAPLVIQAQHTPLPWAAEEMAASIWIGQARPDGSLDQVILGMDTSDDYTLEAKARCKANAALIVKAVNSHEALVKALTRALRIVSDRAAGGRMLTTRQEASETFAQARAALSALNTSGEADPK